MRARSAVIPALLLVALTACGSDSDDPKIDEPPPRVIGCVADTDFGTTPATGVKLSFLGRYESGVFVGSAAEIPAFDAASKRGFIVNSQAGELDVLDLTDPSRPAKVDVRIPMNVTTDSGDRDQVGCGICFSLIPAS